MHGLAFVPIQTASDKAAAIVEAQKAKFAQDKDKYPPGLKEQHEFLLKMLEDKDTHDFEILLYPFGFPAPFPEPEKPYCNIVYMISRPFSRGTIVSRSRLPPCAVFIDRMSSTPVPQTPKHRQSSILGTWKSLPTWRS